jgi:hypothetical protein
MSINVSPAAPGALASPVRTSLTICATVKPWARMIDSAKPSRLTARP